MAKPATTARPRKKERKNIIAGVAHVAATFNNTMITITDAQGNTIAWSSSGMQGFKGSRKSTPYAAQVAADQLGGAAQVLHQPRLGLDPPRRGVVRGDDARGGRDNDEADRRSGQQLDHRHARLESARHHRLQQRRLTSAAFAVVESLPEAYVSVESFTARRR